MSDEKLVSFDVRETIGMTPVNPAEVVPEAYGPVITKCRTGDHRCRNCAYCNPDTNHCTVRSRVMDSPGTTVCMQWAARVPLQPDGSLKMQARETIGAETVNTDAVAQLQTLCNEVEPCKAKVTFQYEKQPVFGGTSLNELEAKTKVWGHQQEAKALDRGAKQGMTLEALDTVFAIACQQVPSMEKRWMELRAEINIMFAQKWAAEDMPK